MQEALLSAISDSLV